jgi:hypothetical protein
MYVGFLWPLDTDPNCVLSPKEVEANRVRTSTLAFSKQIANVNAPLNGATTRCLMSLLIDITMKNVTLSIMAISTKGCYAELSVTNKPLVLSVDMLSVIRLSVMAP